MDHPAGDAAPITDTGDATPSDDTPPRESKSLAARFKAIFKPEKTDDEVDRDESLPPVPFLELFAYSVPSERWRMAIACIAAVAHGTILPLFTIIFGRIIDVFGPAGREDAKLKDLTSEIGGVAKWFLVLAAAAFVTSFIQVRFQLVFAQRVANRLRRLFFDSLMRQDYSWYDQNDGGELTARVASDVNLVEAGIGDKVSTAVQFMSMFVTGFIIAFIYGWKLTLVILAIAPLLAIGGALFGKLAADSTSEGLGAYGSAGAIANEALNLIRTVTAFNGQETEAKRYEAQLQHAYKSGVMKSAFSGAALGFTYFIIFVTFAVAFTFGAGQVRNGSMKAGDVIVTFFSVFIATISIGQASPAFNAFAVARGAAPRVYEVIRRKSEIDPLSEDEGKVLDNVQGNIEFKEVDFNYPTRNVDDLEDGDARPYVLQSFNLSIPAGVSQALVGSSGCGKSTSVRLIERFYDVDNGQVLLDGVDIRELNVRWLRSQIGYVGQMPTLFMLSIRENIALGAAMEVVNSENGKTVLKRKDVREEEIVEAAKKANAHDFIMKLPEKYDTLLGERGALLSGGQKQRVCIARALIRNPKILLLDESTSALDAQSERVVQDALDAASKGRTTITIAHRLSTVKDADVISVIDNGTVAESGTHGDLINVEGGAYRTLVEYQNVEAQKQTSETDVSAFEEGIAEAGVKSKTESISKTVHLEGGEIAEDELPPTDSGVLTRALMMNIKELPFILMGMAGAAIAGATFPAIAITFASVIDVMFEEDNESEVRKWSLLFVLIGGLAFLGYFLQLFMLGVSGERLTRKIRGLAFRALLRQEISFFDKKENSVGQLTSRLATESTLVKGITGDTLGGASLVVSTLLTGFLIAFLSCWRVALVVTVIFPFMAISEAAQIKLVSGFDADASKKFALAGAVASEAVDNFDTLSAIGVQDIFIDKYNEELKGPLRTGEKTALSSGITFGIAECLAQALWAISFWVGSIFVQNKQCDFEGLMKAVSGLLFAGSSMGQAALFMPDFGKSKVAATSIFRLLDHQSSIDPTSGEGVSKDMEGNIAAKGVAFEYPTRPDVPVLRGLSMDVSPGQTLALVGKSGCGKSTVVSLIERFYDPRAGHISADETDIKDLEVNGLRSQIGFVSQEPDLFNRSVRDNIAYGLGHTDGTPVTDSMIHKAAIAANAHDFIQELPSGYDTVVGVRGSKLSGGQRQRVAIARSLVREPKVLLLDEASSALDAVSERMVQDALNDASRGRTTITIAHRLSTIKDADVIGVVQKGKIVESGAHSDLLKKNGAYAKLVQNQMSTTS